VASPARSAAATSALTVALAAAGLGPHNDLAVGGASYIAGLGPLPDATLAAQPRRGSPPGLASATTTWADVTASPPTSSTLDTAIAIIQAVVEASRDRKRATTLALQQEHVMSAALTT
jgi:hypothetical protein